MYRDRPIVALLKMIFAQHVGKNSLNTLRNTLTYPTIHFESRIQNLIIHYFTSGMRGIMNYRNVQLAVIFQIISVLEDSIKVDASSSISFDLIAAK